MYNYKQIMAAKAQALRVEGDAFIESQRDQFKETGRMDARSVDRGLSLLEKSNNLLEAANRAGT